MQQGPEADTNRVLAGAEHWVRLDRASTPAAASGTRSGQLDPAGEGPLVMVAGWEDGHQACAPFVASDGGQACRGCPVALVTGVMSSGRAADDRCPFGIRMLAFPAPAGSRSSAAVLRLGTPESTEADLPSGRAILHAARRLRTSDGMLAWEAEQRARGAERRRTAAAALAQMIATTEEFHRLYTAADRDRASVESSMTRLDTLARETLRESEEARVAVAHALHDTAGQSVVAAHRFLEAARTSLTGAKPDSAGGHLDAAQERLLATIKEIRTVLNNLVPPGLEELGLSKALERYVEEFVPPEIRVEITGQLPRAEYWLEAGLFAMAAEAITNAVRHGQPSHLKIDLRAARGRGIITVTDDGVGFDPAAARRRTQEGMGLIGMQRRAGWLGGRVDIVSRQGTGTTISITVPLEDPERTD
jgi:signal transduction histidine kinase